MEGGPLGSAGWPSADPVGPETDVTDIVMDSGTAFDFGYDWYDATFEECYTTRSELHGQETNLDLIPDDPFSNPYTVVGSDATGISVSARPASRRSFVQG